MPRDERTIPIVIIQQGGEPKVIGEARVSEQGLVEGQLERKALDEVVHRTMGNISFAIQIPRQLLRRIATGKPGHHRKH